MQQFGKPYFAHFLRSETRQNAQVFLEGLLSDLPRKNLESIAYRYEQERIRKTSVALKGTYDDLVARLRKEKHLHSDETGSKENGERRWTWCLRANSFTVFHIDPSRGSDVLKAILGEDFAGKIGGSGYGRSWRRVSSKERV